MKHKLVGYILRLLLLIVPYSISYASTWLQSDLEYNQLIDGKLYLAQISLLRPAVYFKEKHALKPGAKLTVDLPEMGLDNVKMEYALTPGHLIRV